MAPEGTANPQRWAEPATLDERSDWDCEPEEERVHLEQHRVTRSQEGGLKSYEYHKTQCLSSTKSRSEIWNREITTLSIGHKADSEQTSEDSPFTPLNNKPSEYQQELSLIETISSASAPIFKDERLNLIGTLRHNPLGVIEDPNDHYNHYNYK
ncbi:hypothetical protein Celaphus_00019462 [Cervus elaphus hippelaphus]|uniref:Uncharacterized protein n=1 Tax=Cervus elaphus hippelaphus TaxID=46360 RepID=A0A212C3J3_CEREH|nr:hypothetical protein Celaphus_00019462 [Cervus elaphus hippelaphus]